MLRRLKTSFLLLVLAALSSACALKPTRFVFRENADEVYYLSKDKDKPPFRATVHGANWKVQQVQDDTIIMSRIEPSPATVNFYEYHERRFDPIFFKDGYTDGQALREYAKAEFRFYKSKNQNPTVISENVEGPIKPNFLWTFTTPNGAKVFNITTAKDLHLINIAYQSTKPTSQDDLLAIFRSIIFVSPKEATNMISKIEEINEAKE